MPYSSDDKLDDLREAAKSRGLPTSGNKDDLIERLNAAEAGDEGAATPGSPVQDSEGAPTANPGNTTNAPDVADRQIRQAEQTIDNDPQTGNVVTEESPDAGIGEGSAANLGTETTDADAPAEDDVPRGDPGDQFPEHGSIGLEDTGRGREHAEILQGLSDERRAQQLEAAGSQGDSDGDGQPDDGQQNA